MFVEKCSEEMKKFCVKKDVTWEEVEEKLLQSWLNIKESAPESERDAAFEAKGFGPMSDMGAYGLSKAAVNCYTMVLANRFPKITSTSCSPGFVETDLTQGFATRSGKTPAEMGMISVDQVQQYHHQYHPIV